MYTYVFHRHVSDGSFHIENEFKTPILPGLFDEVAYKNATVLDERITDILEAASLHLPNSFFHLRLRPYDCQSSECLPPILVRLSSEAIKLNKKKLSPILQTFHRRLDNNSSFYFHPEKSLGALTDPVDETALNWFAISLLRHSFVDWKVQNSPIILDVDDKDLFVTLAVSLNQALPEEENRVVSVRQFIAFGHKVKVVTLRYPDLGLYAARSHVFGLTSDPTVLTSRDGTSGKLKSSYWLDGKKN